MTVWSLTLLFTWTINALEIP